MAAFQGALCSGIRTAVKDVSRWGQCDIINSHFLFSFHQQFSPFDALQTGDVGLSYSYSYSYSYISGIELAL